MQEGTAWKLGHDLPESVGSWTLPVNLQVLTSERVESSHSPPLPQPPPRLLGS